MTYDAPHDGHQGYLDAIPHMRLRGLLKGRYKPATEAERRLVIEARVMRAFDEARKVGEQREAGRC